jgi:uncharacterized protein
MGDISSEPSMEEILASIKKIIAEDGDKVVSKARRAPVREGRFDDLGQELKRVDAEADEAPAIPPAISEETPEPVEAPIAANAPQEEVLELTESVAETTPSAADKPNITLVSSNTETVSRNALASLSALIVKPEVNGSDTLEGMVREMLKPMLKEWLDAKLPDLVEQMVAKEISRISGRGL